MKQLSLLALLAALLSPTAEAADGWYRFFDSQFTVDQGGTKIQAGVLANRQARGTVIYLPGFADTIDNHEALLSAFRAQGLHVIAFDYPEHGRSTGGIRWWGLKELAEIIPTVLAHPSSGFQPRLPVVLAGWSTGGTIAIRVAQAWRDSALPAGTRLAGVVAFAPALPAKVVVTVNKSDLTSGSMRRGPQPGSVPVVGQFSASIMLQSKLAASSGMPSDVPALVVVAGERDSFASSSSAVAWVKRQERHVVGFQCTGAKHGLEFEAGHGATARGLAAAFAAASVRGDTAAMQGKNPSACPRIR